MNQLTIGEVGSTNSAVVSAPAGTITTAAYGQASHTELISLLENFYGKEITAKLEYIKNSFNSGYASFSPGAPYCIQVEFDYGLQQRGMNYKTLRDEYIIRGKLVFDEDKMKQYVRSMPIGNFFQEHLQRGSDNPLKIAKDSVQVVMKSDNNVNLVTELDLTPQQKYVYDTIYSLYNTWLNAKVISLNRKQSLPHHIYGVARGNLQNNQYLFIDFRIKAENITPEIVKCLTKPYGKITGKLSYNYNWLISKITTGETLLHSSWFAKPPSENQIFFAPSTVSISK